MASVMREAMTAAVKRTGRAIARKPTWLVLTPQKETANPAAAHRAVERPKACRVQVYVTASNRMPHRAVVRRRANRFYKL